MSLSNAQIERLDLLQEECAEVIQAASKIKRFGPESGYPLDRPDSNKEHLEIELGGLAAITSLMTDADDVDGFKCEIAMNHKLATIGKYTKYQKVEED